MDEKKEKDTVDNLENTIENTAKIEENEKTSVSEAEVSNNADNSSESKVSEENKVEEENKIIEEDKIIEEYKLIEADGIVEDNADISVDLSEESTEKKHKILRFGKRNKVDRRVKIEKKKAEAEQVITEKINEMEEVKSEVISAKKDSRLMLQFQSIRVKLVCSFLIPVILIILLGVLSYTTASKAIISSFETSAQSTIQKTSDYYYLMFSNVKNTANNLANNATLQRYYSKSFTNDLPAESTAYNSLKTDALSANMTSDAISNIYIVGSYGKDIITATMSSTEESLYKGLSGSDEGKLVDSNNSAWFTKHEFIDSKCSGSYALSYARQLLGTNKKSVGYMFFDLDSNYVTNPLKDVNMGDKSIIALIAPDGSEIVSGQNIEIDSNTVYFSDKDFYKKIIDGKDKSGYEYVNYNGKRQLFIYAKNEAGFTVCEVIPQSVIVAKAGSIKTITIIAVIIAFGIALAIGGVIATSMSTAIHNIMSKLEKAADGDLTVVVNSRRKDEFKVLADSINNMVGKMKLLIQETKSVSSMVDDSAQTVTGSTLTLLDATRGITDSISGIEKGIVQQANDSESCMRQMDVLSEKINIVSDNSNKIAEIAEGTKEIVKTGLGTIDELNSNVKDTVDITNAVIVGIETLQESSKSIGNIISVINEIAEQTNLLSLNASIEAARAGDAGRGFAVVADEIRKLADQSVASANQIRMIIDEINAKTKATVTTAKQAENVVAIQEKSLKNTLTVFNDIQDQVGELVNNVNNIASGLNDIAESKSETLQAIENISAVSEETAATAEEVTETATKQMDAVENLNKAAESLNKNAGALSQAIDLFIV